MRVNTSSIVYSWLLALVFFAIINVWANPPVEASQAKSTVKLSNQLLSDGQMDLAQIKAAAWCALDSHQVAVMTVDGQTRKFRGSMGIAPEWNGEKAELHETQNHLDSCIALRLEQVAKNESTPGCDRSALTFLFSDL